MALILEHYTGQYSRTPLESFPQSILQMHQFNPALDWLIEIIFDNDSNALSHFCYFRDTINVYMRERKTH